MKLLATLLLTSLSVFSSTIIVTNTNDAGVGSLRQALASAGSGDVINFSIGSGLQSIQLTSGDLIISQPITIDGTTQPGFSCASPVPQIELWGSSGNGIFINAVGVTIRSLCVNRCSQSGIYINGDNATIQGCFIGVNPAGTADFGNAMSGIALGGGADNLTVGGTTLCQRNIISGNGNHGIEVNGGSTGISIVNNYIGTDISGTADLGNSQHGIRAYNSSAITIGGTLASQNVVSGNDNQGMDIETCSNVTIRSNLIGLSTGGSALGNTFTGITLRTNCSNVQVGGNVADHRNVIGSNGGMGIDAINSTGISIRGNYIGVSITGLVARGNAIHGIQVIGCPSTIIGGDRSTEGNIISNSTIHGINYDPGGNGGTIQGNLIGTDANGTAAFGNGYINVVVKSNSMTIGGLTANLGNVIVDAKDASIGTGLLLANANNCTVHRNLIGIGLDGTTALGNRTAGINISVEDAGHTASNNIIEYNTIAYNAGHGVTIGDALPVADFGAGGYSGCEAEDQNCVVRNSIFCNTLKGINLNKGGCDAGNVDKTTPTINSGTATNFFIQGTANANDSIHIYAQGNCLSCSQGKTFIAGVRADGAGNWSYSTAVSFGGQTTVTATDASNNTSEFATCVSLPLPVTWLLVEGNRRLESNEITWITGDERGHAYFAVERSTDGSNFEQVAVVNHGVQGEMGTYRFSEEYSAAYYRIRQVDLSGEFAYSKTVYIGNLQMLAVYPNPVLNELHVVVSEKSTCRVISVTGHLLKEASSEGGGEILLDVSDLSTGYYIIEVRQQNGTDVLPFLKQ